MKLKFNLKLRKDLELRTISNNLRSLELSNREKDDRIKSLEKANHEYESIIRDLQDKIELVEEEESENNKFDMLRIQAKEISEKSREIDRLNGLIEHYKKKDESNKIDKVINKVESKQVEGITLQEVTEPVNKETGEVNQILYMILGLEPSPGGSIRRFSS